MTDDCRLCGVQHDNEIHAATLRVHSWLRARLRRVLEPPPVKSPQLRRRLGPPMVAVAAVQSLRCPAARKKEARAAVIRGDVLRRTGRRGNLE
jgi:hypothetical protein